MAPLPRPRTRTVEAIYAWHEREAEERESIGLGLSAVGNPCDRALWYTFRWASPRKAFDGRKVQPRIMGVGSVDSELSAECHE